MAAPQLYTIPNWRGTPPIGTAINGPNPGDLFLIGIGGVEKLYVAVSTGKSDGSVILTDAATMFQGPAGPVGPAGQGFLKLAFSLTAAQLAGLSTGFIELLPPVPGKTYVLIMAFFHYLFGGTPYTAGGVSSVRLIFENDPTHSAIISVNNSVFTGGQSVVDYSTGFTNSFESRAQGSGIQIINNGNPGLSGGNGTLTGELWYDLA